jgi:hypothetical protein
MNYVSNFRNRYLTTRPRKVVAGLVCAVLVGVVGAACNGGSQPSALSANTKAANKQLSIYNQNQPIQVYNHSDYRQDLLNIEYAQVHGVATTTFFYNMGSNVPVKSCPSIGYPLASTSELTNPEEPIFEDPNGNGTAGVTVGQIDPNGVYTGDSTGSYVVCVLSSGQTEINYWEGWVYTEGGPANISNGQIVDRGVPSVAGKKG